MAPHLNEFKGACSQRGRYKLELVTEGAPTARDLRNIIKMLEVTATWLEEDEPPRMTEAELMEALEPLTAGRS
jgi:hypothetical protein